MTPLLIEIMLHYHCRADDYRDGDFRAPAVREGIDWLRDDAKMIEHQSGDRTNMYRLTERGKAYVEYLQMIPLPTASWTFGQVQWRGMDTPAFTPADNSGAT